MKKTLSINLSGMVFDIDDDAYRELQIYLTQIESHFADAEESKEILADIEARIAELFKEKVNGSKQVIIIEDVEEVIKILGRPEEIGESVDSSEESKRDRFGPSGYRRIYRDPDNRILGGVCSGMGAYFHIDPIIIRIIFVIGTLIGIGTGLIIYLILWIVIPEAKTTVQKLEMKGEPVNISNIGKSVKEEFNRVRKNMNL
jgi:phage shock protein PspC (stress-responsive transcriptional regulator)